MSMHAFVEFIENDITHNLASVGAVLAECIGMVVLMITLYHGVKAYCQKKEAVRLDLARGISVALEFMLAGEVFKTIVAASWEQAGMVGAIIVLRVALTFLLHWEITTEEKNEKALENKADK